MRRKTRPMVRSSMNYTGVSPPPARRRCSIAARRLCSTGPGSQSSRLWSWASRCIVQALNSGAYAGAAVVGGFLGLCVWQSGTYFLRNRPGRYRPDALPKELVPDG
ncbi:MAG TPA: hypothetical protein VNC81_10750 [Xanthobacteraceae bacterium]|nr:hypothetical protein [Xanthobacteraceae bacterium]